MNTSFIISPGNSFFLSTTAITGSSPGSNIFAFNQYIYYVSVAPSGSSANIEYFIAEEDKLKGKVLDRDLVEKVVNSSEAKTEEAVQSLVPVNKGLMSKGNM
jgi:hypothetical protein